MRKRVITLLASTMTVVGMIAGVTPAHAVPKPDLDLIAMYSETQFRGEISKMDPRISCEPIFFGSAHSARNESQSNTYTFYRDFSRIGICFNVVTTLGPGESDSGYIPGTDKLSELGSGGALFVGVTSRGR